jgi:hypothetical protein
MTTHRAHPGPCQIPLGMQVDFSSTWHFGYDLLRAAIDAAPPSAMRAAVIADAVLRLHGRPPASVWLPDGDRYACRYVVKVAAERWAMSNYEGDEWLTRLKDPLQVVRCVIGSDL